MTSFSQLKSQIAEYYDLEERDQRKIQAEIKAYADTVGQAKFIQEIRENFPQDRESDLEVIYTILATEPRKWLTFFAEEFERAFQNATMAPNAKSMLDSLDTIAMADENYTLLSDAILKVLCRYSDHPDALIRYMAVWFMSDWLTAEKRIGQDDAIQKLRDRSNDKNWKIRVLSATILQEIGQRSKGIELKWSDKIRKRFGSYIWKDKTVEKAVDYY